MKIHDKSRITIPKDIVNQLNLKQGDIFTISITKAGNLVIKFYKKEDNK